eukprot:CAMPEP_0174928216 /NCGR_PEP_ID=MMETSP1355-20121228/22795_1 /TAXON_ID=464990 /ORGANISM="Hemiselmis tepida, Strain CCMP443" /LENGTH=638 /DNA_ID=CAMNT_0016174365 /DNA_START=51 /DNA_END=1963 /DNA_ORIENTATION=-
MVRARGSRGWSPSPERGSVPESPDGNGWHGNGASSEVSDEHPRSGGSSLRNKNRRPDINLLSLRWADEQPQDDDRRTCAATDATSDAGGHDLEGFDNDYQLHELTEMPSSDEEHGRAGSHHSHSERLFTCGATSGASDGGKTADLDLSDFREVLQEAETAGLNGLNGHMCDSAADGAGLDRLPGLRGGSSYDDDEMTTHGLAGEAASVGDLRDIEDEKEEVLRKEHEDTSPVSQLRLAVRDTWDYLRCMLHFLRGGAYDSPPCLGKSFGKTPAARVHAYAKAVPYLLWGEAHYRGGTVGRDMARNLRNVALPGTGLPLSLLCASRTLYGASVLVLPPLYSLAAAVLRRDPRGGLGPLIRRYREQLLRPPDWFSAWRANCSLSTLHAHVTKDEGYLIEDKFVFLQEARRLGLPTTPMLRDVAVVVKHRNEEGGLGFQSFSNASGGGDWIIQPRLHNSRRISGMLPPDAPLSTLRLVSCCEGGGMGGEILSCVWRAGRSGAETDHSSVLFDVDPVTGEVRGGASNGRWYKLGPLGAAGSLAPKEGEETNGITRHPDTGSVISGWRIPDFASIRDMVSEAHGKMAAGVPLIGWDVGLTTGGILLLEANLSCNFFRASYDRDRYHNLLDEHFAALSKRLNEG